MALVLVIVSVKIEACRDQVVRRLGISLGQPLGCDYTTWQKRIMVSPSDVGKTVLEINWALQPGTYLLYLNITDYEPIMIIPGGNSRWDVTVTIKAGNKIIKEVTETISKPGTCGGGGGGNALIDFTVPSDTTSPPNYEYLINMIMTNFMPVMIGMTMMSMMIQVITRMMTGITEAMA